MGSCTMIQFAVGGKLKNIVTGGEAKTRHLTLAEEMICGIGAGAVSGLAGSPLELIMIQQQRKGGNTISTIKNIIKNPPDVYRGFMGAAIREALWTCGYLSIPPVVRRTLMESYPDTFTSNDKARVPAALLGGLFACYMTQWADTIKTCMQGDIERKTYGSFTQTAKTLYAESGIPGFYRGATFRYGRMACKYQRNAQSMEIFFCGALLTFLALSLLFFYAKGAVFIMDLSAEFFAKAMYPSAFNS